MEVTILTMNPMTPQFKHDCHQCVFVGRYEITWGFKNYDLYFCKNCFDLHLIARYGSEGWEYISCSNERVGDYIDDRHPLKEAERRYRRCLLPTFVEIDE